MTLARKKTALFGFLFIGATAIAMSASAQDRAQQSRDRDQQDDEDTRARLFAELMILKRSVKDLEARVQLLERALANGAAPGPAQISDELGISLPGGPRGGTGSDSVLKLPVLLHHAVMLGKPADDLSAFGELTFIVPEPLWQQVARGHELIRGLPTKGELELGLAELRACGAESTVAGVEPAPMKNSDERAVRSVVMRVATKEGRETRFVVTAVRMSGRWLVAHIYAQSVVDRVRALVRDAADSALAFRAFRGRMPGDLQELAADREALESSENLRRAGFKFSLGPWLDKMKEDGLAWNGGALSTHLYAVRLKDGEVTASPILGGPSYATLRCDLKGKTPDSPPQVREER